MKKRIDPHSGESFYPKRNNQRFATRANQIAFNNAKAQKEREIHLNIDNQIKKNWNILKSVLGKKKTAIKTKDYLLGRRYSFRFFNNLRTQDDISYYGIYDYGIRSLGDGNFEIINFSYE
ncbi:hypothetical protein N9C19_00105 [bacterium]|nr:hypothetical protein [bacterium]